MAGAGYKLFNTGDVLTAAQVNTYLQEQTVMVFASAAARTTALSAVLAEGMISYLKDTDTVEVYNGSAWVGFTGDLTAITAGTGITVTSGTGPIPTVALTTPVSVANGGTGITSFGTGIATFLGTPSSANLAAALTDETGTGANVFATSPTLVTPNLGTPSAATLTNATGLPITAGTTGTLGETRGGTAQTTYTTGDLLYASGTNTLAKRAIGATGNVLTVSGGVPTWAAPAGGSGITLITRQVISASSGTNIDSIFSSTYINYFITIDNITGATSSDDFRLQFRYGTTTQASTFYKYFDFEFGNTVTSTEFIADWVTISPNLGNSTDGAFVTGYISKVGNSSQKPQFQLQLQDQSAGTPRLFFGKVNDAQTYTGIRLTPSAGTFSGTVSIYGLAK